MGRKVSQVKSGVKIREPYRRAGLTSGGMACQMEHDGVVFDVWGNRLALCRTSGNAGTVWLRLRKWLGDHHEAGALAEAPYASTLEEIMAWVKNRKTLYEELDEEQRKDFAAFCGKNIRA
jgi:hypothetical protein